MNIKHDIMFIKWILKMNILRIKNITSYILLASKSQNTLSSKKKRYTWNLEKNQISNDDNFVNNKDRKVYKKWK